MFVLPRSLLSLSVSSSIFLVTLLASHNHIIPVYISERSFLSSEWEVGGVGVTSPAGEDRLRAAALSICIHNIKKLV